LPDATSEAFKPLLLKFFLFNPLSYKEAQPTMTTPKEHVAWWSLRAKSNWKDIGNIGECWEKAAFAVEVMSSVKLECFIVFEGIDEDEGRSDKNKFIWSHVSDVEDRLIKWLFSFYDLILGGTVVDSESKTHWIIVIHSFLIAVVVVVAHSNIMLEHAKADDRLVAKHASPMRNKVLPEDFKAFPGVSAVVLAGAVNSHKFFSDTTLHLTNTETLVNVAS
jgi:hypothetical protein